LDRMDNGQAVSSDHEMRTDDPSRQMADTQPTPRVLRQAHEQNSSRDQNPARTIRSERPSSTSVSHSRGSRDVPPPQRPGYRSPGQPLPPCSSAPPPAKKKRQWGFLLLKAGFAAVALVVILFFVAVAASVVGYVTIANQLPSPTELQDRRTAFVSSKIYDRGGGLLYEVMDPEGGRRTYVPLDEMSEHIINATVATEDRDFWVHPGFDPVAMARAIYYVLTEGEIVSGASTISQQLARMVLLPDQRFEKSADRKIKEIILAAELTRAYSKDAILETYLNELNYGNRAYGIQAAAETYFEIEATDLTLAQASFLAGLPQLPATYDPFGGGLELALSRQETVLRLMVGDGHITRPRRSRHLPQCALTSFEHPNQIWAGRPISSYTSNASWRSSTGPRPSTAAPGCASILPSTLTCN